MAEKINREDYIKAALSQLEAARKELEVGVYPSTVLDACFAIDNVINAFFMTIGARPAKRHRWTLAIMNAVKYKAPRILKWKTFNETLDLIKDIEAGAHIIRSRYPFTLKGQKFVPKVYYTKELTEKILSKTETIFSQLTKIIQKVEAKK